MAASEALLGLLAATSATCTSSARRIPSRSNTAFGSCRTAPRKKSLSCLLPGATTIALRPWLMCTKPRASSRRRASRRVRRLTPSWRARLASEGSEPPTSWSEKIVSSSRRSVRSTAVPPPSVCPIGRSAALLNISEEYRAQISWLVPVWRAAGSSAPPQGLHISAWHGFGAHDPVAGVAPRVCSSRRRPRTKLQVLTAPKLIR